MRVYVSVLYLTDQGRSPVEDFLNRLHFRTRQAFLRTRILLEERGPLLIEPHAKKVDRKHGIYELRFTGTEGRVRILYFFIKNHRIVFTNGFIKKSQKLDRAELKTAILRKQTYLERLKK